MVTKVFLKGMAEFADYVKGIDPKGPQVFFCFTGEKLPSGQSWCRDCNDAQPAIDQFLAEVSKNIIFAYVDVGDMVSWRKKDCPFRTDSRTKLMVIPTIIKWKGVQRLEGEQCSKKELLQMLVEDDDE